MDNETEKLAERIEKRLDRIEAWMLYQSEKNGNVSLYKKITWFNLLSIIGLAYTALKTTILK